MGAPALPLALWDDLLGLPYRQGARGPDAYDCWGLLLEVLRRRGIVTADQQYDERGRVSAAAEAALRGQWKPCAVRAGAALLFRSDDGGFHVGVALDDDRFLHANRRDQAVVVSFLSRGMRRYLLGSYEPA